MKPHAIHVAFSCLSISVLIAGCQTTRTITKRSEFERLKRDALVKIITRDSVTFELVGVSLVDSVIFGTGVARTSSGVQRFQGGVPFSHIRYIQSGESGFWTGLLAVGAVGYVGYTAISYLNEGNQDFRVNANIAWYQPGGGGGSGGGTSCPTIYAWDGDRYVVQGEAISVALGRGLEMATVNVLPSLRSDGGISTVRITNERAETHYLNAVSLEAVMTDERAEVVADPGGTFWPVYQLRPPAGAIDFHGNDVLARIQKSDSDYWESSLSGSGSTFEDGIELTLPVEGGRTEGTLLIRGINTQIFNTVLRNISSILGDDYLEFTKQLDEDPELIQLMRGWMSEVSLSVTLWNGREWVSCGSMIPEATTVPFTKGMRLNVGNSGGTSVKIRLTSLADVWNIDAVGIDWTPVGPLQPAGMKLLSAQRPDGQSVADDLGTADSRYVVVLPGQQVDCRFGSMKGRPGKKVIYALGVQGYLYEWPVEEQARSPKILPVSMGMKVGILKTMLRNRNVILPPIYEEWNREQAVRRVH